MDLYSITIMFSGSQNLIRLMFKSRENADNVGNTLRDFNTPPRTGAVHFTDDYGKTAYINMTEFAGATYACINEELNAAMDEQILQAHGQIKMNKRVAQDSEIQAESRKPSIVQPAGFVPNGAMRQ